MIKIIEQGQKTFTKTCDRCGCKFQYDLSDLSGLDYINCPCCHTTLIHIGPRTKKVGPNDTDLNEAAFTPQRDCQPYKVEVGDGRYNYATTTGPQYINPNPTVTISETDLPKSDSYTITGGDPNTTIYANKLPDDIGDDPYNNIGMQLPDDIKDNCCYESDSYKAWHEKWCKRIKENEPIKCKKK